MPESWTVLICPPLSAIYMCVVMTEKAKLCGLYTSWTLISPQTWMMHMLLRIYYCPIFDYFASFLCWQKAQKPTVLMASDPVGCLHGIGQDGTDCGAKILENLGEKVSQGVLPDSLQSVRTVRDRVPVLS